MDYEIGKKICEAVDSTKINLTGENDGRTESFNSEDEVTNCIREKCSDTIFLPKGHNREFGDITAVGVPKPQDMIHINVKMVNPKTTSTFNGGSVKLLNFVFFGEIDDGIKWTPFAKKMKKYKPSMCVCNYYYLIYFKNSDRKCIFCSLGDIALESITTNPSNPIQLKTNITIVKRTPEEQAKFIKGLFEQFIDKRAQPYLVYYQVSEHISSIESENNRLSSELERYRAVYGDVPEQTLHPQPKSKFKLKIKK